MGFKVIQIIIRLFTRKLICKKDSLKNKKLIIITFFLPKATL